MKTETIHVNNHGSGVAEVLQQAEDTAVHYGLNSHASAELRLLTEETMEMIRSIAGDFDADFHIEGSHRGCALHFKAATPMDEEKRQRLMAASAKDREGSGLAGRIGGILQNRYRDPGQAPDELEEIGIRKADSALIRDMGHEEGEEGFVWSLQSYEMSVFDRTVKQDISEEAWAEISRSIIANLADDIRIGIFRDSAEIIVQKNFEDRSRESAKKYAIDPEFEKLKKIPIATSRMQVRMIQLMYRNLRAKEKSTETVTVTREKLPVPSAPKGRLSTMIYTPKALEGQSSPCVLLLHGGAFVFPALPYHYRLARKIAEGALCRVFMPFYDLAPSYIPPLQQEEVLNVYRYLRNYAQKLMIDPEKIAVAGDSAGGTLTAALMLMLRDREMPLPTAQCLFYPSLDTRFQSESMKEYTDVPVCNTRAVLKYQELCHNDVPVKRDYLSPLETASLAGMPATYVETAEFDCLHDDGIAYAERLKEEGVRVLLNETKGTVHAFDMAKDSRILAKAMEQRIGFLNGVFTGTR